MTGTVARIAAAERIAQLDILRGLAILLILFMNIQYMGDFADPDYMPQRLSWTGFDQAAWWFNRFLDGTQRGLLELLFGAGVLIMARTAMTPDGPVAAADLHYRRNLWLAAFGIAHGVVLLWPGDILLSYATAALLVFPFRTLKVRQLLIVGIAMSATLQAWNVAEYLDRVDLAARAAVVHEAWNPAPSAAAEMARLNDELNRPDPKLLAREVAGHNGSLVDFANEMRGIWVIVQFTGIGIYYENAAEAFATMLIGMALFKTGIIQGRAGPRTYWWLLILGYGIGVGLRIQSTLTELEFSAAPRIGMFTHGLARLPITLGHVGAVTLLLRTRLGARLLTPFQATGKMPLTTYMGASAAALLVFGPLGGQFARYGYGTLAAGAAVLIAVQLVGANLWLRAFASGPLEWLWKSLAYNRRQPFRRAIAGAEVMS